MNAILKYCLLIIAIIVLLWVIARVTNILELYSIPTIANYPSIQKGDRVFTSNLKTPERFDFIAYTAITVEFGKQVWLHRLCGLEGDKIEISAGDLYVNDQFVDGSFSIAHHYILTLAELERLKAKETIHASLVQNTISDSIIISLPEKTILKYSVKARKLILSKNYADEFIQQQYAAKWNQDYFGPIVVPKGKYFVLGDNRLNANDSRYIGFVDQSAYIGTVIWR